MQWGPGEIQSHRCSCPGPRTPLQANRSVYHKRKEERKKQRESVCVYVTHRQLHRQIQVHTDFHDDVCWDGGIANVNTGHLINFLSSQAAVCDHTILLQSEPASQSHYLHQIACTHTKKERERDRGGTRKRRAFPLIHAFPLVH